jgi:transposase
MLHKTRELLIKQRTMSINALRCHLSEFGIVAAKGIGRVDELLDLAESDATLPNAARASVKVLAQALEILWVVDSDQRSGRVRLRNRLLWRRPCQP